jgi:hypothetical protein
VAEETLAKAAKVEEVLHDAAFAEAQPLVGVELAGFFEAVLDQVEDDDAAAGLEDAVASLTARSGCRA